MSCGSKKIENHWFRTAISNPNGFEPKFMSLSSQGLHIE